MKKGPFATWLERQIMEHDWTLKEAGEILGIDPSVLSRYLSGEVQEPRRKNLRLLAKGFGVERAELEELINQGLREVSPKFPIGGPPSVGLWRRDISGVTAEEREKAEMLTRLYSETEHLSARAIRSVLDFIDAVEASVRAREGELDGGGGPSRGPEA